MADLVVRGGTVVTATGSAVADVAVEGGRITAVEADLSGPASTAREVVDARGLLVLPGVVDVHTHTRVASDAEPVAVTTVPPRTTRSATVSAP